jgi:flagellar hook-associated protein 2
LYNLGFTSESGTLRITTKDDDGNEVNKDIAVTNGTTISELVDSLKDAGLNASFDTNNGRFYLSSTKSGESGNFELKQVSSTGKISSGGSLLYALGLEASGAEDKAALDSTMSELGYADTKGGLKITTKDPVSGEDVNNFIEFESNETLSTVLDRLNQKMQDENIDAVFTFDSDTGKIVQTGSESAKLTELDKYSGTNTSSRMLQKLGLETAQSTYDERKATKLDGNDATIVLNGVVYTNSSNSFAINGLNITVNAATDDISSLLDANGELDKAAASALKDDTAVNISTSVDAQGIYDTIKDFLTKYNTIINKLTELYNADSATDYEPLTDDEKSEMTDSEIAKWETKIKDSLLRRDTNLGSIMSAMKNAMSQTIKINDKSYALSSFGISTLYYGTAPTNEESAYHIDGDEDDENTSGNTDKLLAAITDDPDTVVSFIKQLATNLYDALDSQMQSSSLRSRYSIYNDKELQDQYDNYTTIISDWEDKVSDKEDYYYDKFASMETALGTLQSQTSALSGLLGS